MTATLTAKPVGSDDLTARIFRALYPEFDLRAINGIYVVVPRGVRWFTGQSLGNIARQISDHDHPGAPPLPGRPR